MKLACRSEVNGLRAIAVSVVILCHTQITILGHQPFKCALILSEIFK